jgi:hypothetical protein
MNAEFGDVFFVDPFSFEPVSQGSTDVRLDLGSIFKEKTVEFDLFSPFALYDSSLTISISGV